MSNPFDQFGSDVAAALPPAPLPSEPPAAPYGAPPSQQQQQQQPGMMYGAPPPADASSNNPYGMPGGGGNPYGAPPPPQPESNPYGLPQEAPPAAPMNNPYGAPPPQDSSNPYGAPQDSNPYGSFGGAPPAESNPYGAPKEANPYGAPPQEANPYGAPPPPPPMEAPSTPGTNNPYGVPQQQQQQQQQPQSQDPFGGGGDGGGAPNPYGLPSEPPQQTTNDPGPYGAAPPSPGVKPPPQEQQPDPNAYADPWGQPAPEQQQQQQMPYGQQPPQQQQQQQQQQQPPFGNDPNMNALVPSQQQSNPYAAYGAPPPQQPPYGQMPPNPYGGGPPQPAFGYGQPAYGAPPPPAPVDPFSVFESKAAPEPPAPEPAATAASGPDPTAPDDDFWSSFGNNNAQAEAPIAPAPKDGKTSAPKDEEEKKAGDDSLPPGGEYYDARIFTPTLGVMFFKPQELTDSLFLNTDKEIVDGLNDRPVVAFIVEGSSARSAGVELGHVLLKVNGVDVRSPKEASRLIKEGPRPLPLLFYVPSTEVVIAEGEHMVKYDTKETVAPNSAKDWKPKYVVIGGIIAQPWMMNMYRSKSEYDIAVIETQARRPVSVKVKQFSLQGARIQNDWQGPQMVKYKNKLHPWKYIVVLPVARNPIKISSPNLSQLKPVHEGIRRVLLAQQRSGGRSGRPASQRDSGRPAHDDYAHQQHQQQPAYAQAGSPYRY